MPFPTSGTVTDLLRAWGRGDEQARDQLVPLVYRELRARAARYLRRERPGHTLQTTDLVHEAYLRLVDQRAVEWRNRSQFFALASQMMRRVLVDHARRRQASKRPGGRLQVALAEDAAAVHPRDVELLLLDRALDELAALDARRARLVELRYFGGLTMEETAETLGIALATVKRDWSFARAWLYRRIRKAPAPDERPR